VEVVEWHSFRVKARFVRIALARDDILTKAGSPGLRRGKGQRLGRWDGLRQPRHLSARRAAEAVKERADKPVLLNRFREKPHDPLPSEQQVSEKAPIVVLRLLGSRKPSQERRKL
jgi:hypothetical protein